MTRVSLTLAVLGLAFQGVTTASLAAGCKDADSVANVLQSGIDLHRSLVRSIAGERQAYVNARREFESYLESDAISCLEAATALLSTTPDDCLAKDVMSFAVEMDDVADERISAALGRLFLTDPDVIERAIRGLNTAQRTVAVDRVRLGWRYVSSAEDMGAEIAADRASRLEALQK